MILHLKHCTIIKNGLFLFFKKRSKIYRQKGRRANVKMKELFNDKSIVGSPVMHYLKLVVLLMVIWLMLSGKLEAKFLIYGLVTSLVSAWICMPLLTVNGVNGDKKYFAFGFPVFKMIAYCFWLLWQLILANIDVAKAGEEETPVESTEGEIAEEGTEAV